MQNLVNIFCPDYMYDAIVSKIEDFLLLVDEDLVNHQAGVAWTQACVFRASWNNASATRATVLCTNSAIADGFFIFHAVETALEKVYPEFYKEKRFVVLMYPRQ